MYEPTNPDNLHRPPVNTAFVAGEMTRDAQSRELPDNKWLLSFDVAIYNEDKGQCDVVPVNYIMDTEPTPIQAGSWVEVSGRMKKRFYQSNGTLQSSTVLVADSFKIAGSLAVK